MQSIKPSSFYARATWAASWTLSWCTTSTSTPARAASTTRTTPPRPRRAWASRTKRWPPAPRTPPSTSGCPSYSCSRCSGNNYWGFDNILSLKTLSYSLSLTTLLNKSIAIIERAGLTHFRTYNLGPGIQDWGVIWLDEASPVLKVEKGIPRSMKWSHSFSCLGRGFPVPGPAWPVYLWSPVLLCLNHSPNMSSARDQYTHQLHNCGNQL